MRKYSKKNEMVVCIDCTLLRNDRVTGVERYIIELIDAFILLKGLNGVRFILLFSKNYNVPIRWINKDCFDIIKSPFSCRIINDQFFIPYIALKRKDIDLFHFPVFANSLFLFKPFLLTNHDSTFWRFPETISKGAKYYYKPLYKISVLRARKIICVSESSKRDLIKYTGITESKISVIYEALSTSFASTKPSNKETLFKQLGIVEPYILTVGTLEPRKNISSLLFAFRLFSKKRAGFQLVVVGRRGWGKDLTKCHEDERVLFTGFIDDSALKALYSNASLFVFPSLYEGFGFPILEAFSCRIPVLTSRTSSLPEIGGNMCSYIESPTDSLEIATKMDMIIFAKSNEQIQNDRNLVFSWIDTAKLTLCEYQMIYDKDIKY